MPPERTHVLSTYSDSTAVATMTDSWVAIVDDHESLRSSLGRALRLEGIRAELFDSAEDYLDHRASSAPRCLVLDLQLPHMGGHELAQYLERERPPRPPTIFISAHEDLLESVDDGSSTLGRLRKPFDLDELLALVTPLL
jgi:FixJ family two-component response regulator